ncbi:aminotransferase class IV [Propioniciclava tarda]|uniref:4-amino-4-deoxychorismate lyase n=1 Tax=Propioniciclava tarda TaxID=433330 RepID=A0A4Q9KKD6_PROTD|nr:aminotransferase class IV [Propioniciclava tarda]TBT94946.1 4-amino-4-deoxychorismate lyase [Propioniciclava tarda]SMO57909.1 branched-chain amino acid aminotransferase [Propioniciclava tarda]
MTWAWLNGRLVDASAPALLVTEPGFTIGDGVFTTTVIEDGVPFALGRNLARLIRHAGRIGLPVPDEAELRVGVRQLLDADGVTSGRLRIAVTPTTLLVSTAPPLNYGPTSITVTLPWQRNEHSPLTGVKSLSFGEASVAQRYFRPLGADEGVLANTAGEVCEGVTSNLFVVLHGRLRTPPLASGCLDGVTREIVRERVQVDETPIPLASLGDVEAAFWASATRKVQPIGRLDGRVLTTTHPLIAEAAAAIAGYRED